MCTNDHPHSRAPWSPPSSPAAQHPDGRTAVRRRVSGARRPTTAAAVRRGEPCCQTPASLPAGAARSRPCCQSITFMRGCNTRHITIQPACALCSAVLVALLVEELRNSVGKHTVHGSSRARPTAALSAWRRLQPLLTACRLLLRRRRRLGEHCRRGAVHGRPWVQQQTCD